MKISGFTVIRNAELMGYPVRESISSLLPLVDEMVVGIGQSDDSTVEIIQSLGSPKIRIFSSHWDLGRTTGGHILSEKTNEALEQCSNNWCFYLQADEVVHEDDLPVIHQKMLQTENDSHIDGLLFDYIHFYGSYQTIATSRKWYRREIRAIKKNSRARSYKDAQGFRIEGNKLRVVKADSRIFHYGWVKPPQLMGQKAKQLDYWWHGKTALTNDKPFFYDNQYGLTRYEGKHPKVMLDLVAAQNWDFIPKRSMKDWRIKDLRYLTSDIFEYLFNYRIGEYRPYHLIK